MHPLLLLPGILPQGGYEGEAAAGGQSAGPVREKNGKALMSLAVFWRSGRDSNPRGIAPKLISRFYSNPPKTGSFRPFKTIVEKFVNAKIMLFSLFLPVGKNRGKNSGKNKIRRILI